MDVQSKLKANHHNQDKTRLAADHIRLENLGNKSNEKMAVSMFNTIAFLPKFDQVIFRGILQP